MKLFPAYEEPARTTPDQEHAIHQMNRALGTFCGYFSLSAAFADEVYDISAAAIQCADTGLRPYQLAKVISDHLSREPVETVDAEDYKESPAVSEIDRQNVIAALRRDVASFVGRGIPMSEVRSFAVKVKACLDNGATGQQLFSYIEDLNAPE